MSIFESSIGSLVGAVVGGLLTIGIGFYQLFKQFKVEKENRRTDFIIRQLEYSRNRLHQIKDEIYIKYNSILHEKDYRNLLIGDKHLAYEEPTNLFLFKEIKKLLNDYLMLEDKLKNRDKEVNQIIKELDDILDNDFYSKVSWLSKMEMKLKNIQNGRGDYEGIDDLNSKTVDIVEEGLKQTEKALTFIKDDIKYINGRLITEESNL